VKRLRAALATAAITAVFLCLPQPAAGRVDPTRADNWRAIAERALAQLQVLDTGGTQTAHTLAFAAQTTAWLSPSGWADPAATAYLTRLYATANPDGGYGLGYAYDAHNDGTDNFASTTYVVSLAGHVGPPLLDAYRSNPTPALRAKVQVIFDLIATAPRIDTAAGRCIAYSRHGTNDAKPGLCVHNVSAGAAAFMLDAGRDGFATPWWLVQGIAQRELSAYNANSRGWPYRDNMAPTLQDDAHNAYSIESVYSLAYPVGYSAAYVALSTAPNEPNSALGYALLVGLPWAPTAASGGTTIWCLLGDARLGDVDAWVTAKFADIGAMAQAAYYSARAARACTVPPVVPPTTPPVTPSATPTPPVSPSVTVSPSVSAEPTTPVTTAPTPTETVIG